MYVMNVILPSKGKKGILVIKRTEMPLLFPSGGLRCPFFLWDGIIIF